MVSVSYTHLDVYKRQGPRSAQRIVRSTGRHPEEKEEEEEL